MSVRKSQARTILLVAVRLHLALRSFRRRQQHRSSSPPQQYPADSAMLLCLLPLLITFKPLRLAEKCKVDSTRIVEKLIRLLTKAGVPGDHPSTIGPDDIEVSKFGRAAWIFLKPQIVVIQRELNSVRIQILLLHTFIDAQTASSERDRATALKLIPGLERSRQRALRLLRLAESQSDKAEGSAMSNRGMALQSAPGTSGISSPPTHQASRVRDSRAASNSRRPPGRMDVVPQTNLPRLIALNDDDINQELEELRREVAQELLASVENDVKEQDAARAHEKRVRDEAVEEYKQDTRARLFWPGYK